MLAWQKPSPWLWKAGLRITRWEKISPAQRVDEIAALAAKHGFRLSGFRSFEREVTEEQIETVRRRARQSRRSIKEDLWEKHAFWLSKMITTFPTC